MISFLGILILPKKFYNTVCWLLLIYCITFEHTRRIWGGCFTCLIFLRDLHQIQQPCSSEKQEHLSPSCTSLNCIHATASLLVSNLVIAFKPIPKDSIFEGSKEMEFWGSKIWAGWWVENNSPCLLCGCFLWFHMRVCLCCHVEGGFSNSVVR